MQKNLQDQQQELGVAHTFKHSEVPDFCECGQGAMHCKSQFLKAEVVQRILHPWSPAWRVGRLPLEENQPYSQVTNFVIQSFVLLSIYHFEVSFF